MSYLHALRHGFPDRIIRMICEFLMDENLFDYGNKWYLSERQ
jgi:hypothetical protein